MFAQSIVSGSMLAHIAADAHLKYEQTLTGFKWIARVPDLTFGYEEALGYCVDPNGVRDKDGITAGLMVAEMAARLKAGTATSCRSSTTSPPSTASMRHVRCPCASASCRASPL